MAKLVFPLANFGRLWSLRPGLLDLVRGRTGGGLQKPVAVQREELRACEDVHRDELSVHRGDKPDHVASLGMRIQRLSEAPNERPNDALPFVTLNERAIRPRARL